MICTDTDHDVNTLATTKKEKKRKKKQTELSTHKKTEKKVTFTEPFRSYKQILEYSNCRLAFTTA